MPDWPQLGAFIAAGLLLNVTPGPDVLYIVGRSLSQGRLAGVVSALGIASGSLVHVAAATFGLSTLILSLPLAYDTVRLAGAAYLVWMGIHAIRSRSSDLRVQAMAATPLGVIFRQGMVTNVLNPKVALFFLAFLPQFTDALRGPLAPQFLLLGVIFIANGLLVCLGYALAASWFGGWLTARYVVHTWLNRAVGALFVGLGVRLALGGRR
ncbi:MAG TPA: LysE family translocator [Vicinamibacterales bacterium]|nr:LysE family translocator [Vicinamibacterales bacterium]